MVLGAFWHRFFDLLPKAPRYVGIIISLAGEGQYIVSLVGGGQIQVYGTSDFSVSDRVFVKDGRIESKAPALAIETIEV